MKLLFVIICCICLLTACESEYTHKVQHGDLVILKQHTSDTLLVTSVAVYSKFVVLLPLNNSIGVDKNGGLYLSEEDIQLVKRGN
jgi:hypothetical protein